MKGKYITFTIICITMLMLILIPSNVLAQESEGDAFTSGDFMYSYDAQTDLVDIISYIGTEERVVVPAYIDGKKVRKLCFVFCTWENNKTKEVVISDGIQIIEGFSGCNKLERVSIPDSVLEIKESAFYDCTKLKKIDIPDSVKKIGKMAFWNCKNLTEVHLPAGLKVINESTFSFCEKLTDIEIPYGVKKVKAGAFYACRSLKEIILPDSVTWLGTDAFCWCHNLEKVKLSRNITVIRRSAFEGCNFKTIEIPKKVTRIESRAFRGARVTKIVIPAKVNYIGLSAFRGCAKLKNITFKGKTPPEINKRAFYDLHSKVTFNVPNKSISKYKKILGDKKIYKGKKLSIK